MGYIDTSYFPHFAFYLKLAKTTSVKINRPDTNTSIESIIGEIELHIEQPGVEPMVKAVCANIVEALYELSVYGNVGKAMKAMRRGKVPVNKMVEWSKQGVFFAVFPYDPIKKGYFNLKPNVVAELYHSEKLFIKCFTGV